MDQMLELYVQDTFVPDMAAEIQRTTELLEHYQMEGFEDELKDIVYRSEDRTKDDTQDAFLSKLQDQVRFVLKSQMFTVSDEAKLFECNEILEALALFQDLEDYTLDINLLESDLEDSEKVYAILSKYCTLTDSKLFELIEEMDDDIIDAMKNLAYQKADDGKEDVGYSENELQIIHNFRRFMQFVKDRPTCGSNLLSCGAMVGLPLEHYINNLGEDLETREVGDIALNVLSIIMLSEDALKEPLLALRRVSTGIFHDPSVAYKVDSIVTQALNEFNTFSKKPV